MKLFITFMAFCAIAYYYRFFKMKDDVKSDPIKTFLDRAIHIQVSLFSLTFSFLITDTTIGFILMTITIMLYILILSMGDAQYSSPKFNAIYMYGTLLSVLAFIFSTRFILINLSSIMLMIILYTMLLYGKWFLGGVGIKPITLYLPFILCIVLVFSVVHYFPEFWTEPQERVATDFIRNTFHGEIDYIHYDKKLRGELTPIRVDYSTSANDDEAHVILIYKNAQIISYESTDR